MKTIFYLIICLCLIALWLCILIGFEFGAWLAIALLAGCVALCIILLALDA